MSFVQPNPRTTTVQSVDIDTHLHYSCRFCHHFSYLVAIRLHFSRDGRYQNKIKCSRCGKENMALGGMKPRLSMMSQETTKSVQRKLSTLFSGGHHDGGEESQSSSSSYRGLHESTLSPPRASISPDTVQEATKNKQDTAEETVNVSETPSPHQPIEHDAATHNDDAQTLPPHSHPHSLHDTTAYEGSTLRTLTRQAHLRNAWSRMLDSSRRFLKGPHTFRIKFGKTKTANAATRQNVEQTTTTVDLGLQGTDPVTSDAPATSTAKTGTMDAPQQVRPRPPAILPAEGEFCSECQEEHEKLRKELTIEKLAQAEREYAARKCPRQCCVFARQHGLDDGDFIEGISANEIGPEFGGRTVMHGTGDWTADHLGQFEDAEGLISSRSDSRGTTHVDNTVER